MIPTLFFNYLRDGDARPLKNIFYHNAIDVISLAALLNHMAGMLSAPIETSSAYGADLISLAKLFEDLRDLDTATRLYLHGLDHIDAREHRLPRNILLDAIHRLALIYKRQENLNSAIPLWEQAAQYNHLPGYLELAKCYEHQLKEYATAIEWSQKAILLLESDEPILQGQDPLNPDQHRQWLDDFHHRLERLQRKMHTGHES